ncbi:MAG: hypothetical protein Q8R10_17315 [Pseudomonas sp.]|uniref:hypothetical protein n=1 Tax=Pseudomonas sp. TaxID=306 RepID=UPI002732385E|nr:hypothetical protein [Pseudomonas sp.]MDP3848177.1 hypothetical protein [Pseudomonas sp.]
MQAWLYLWLLSIGGGHVVLGVALALGAQSSLLTPYFDNLLSQFGLQNAGAETRVLAQTLIQLFGPTVASWGLLFCCLIYLYRRHGEALIKLAVFAALLLWLPLDCLISAAHGLYWHLYLNFAAGLLIALPLALLKPQQAP